MSTDIYFCTGQIVKYGNDLYIIKKADNYNVELVADNMKDFIMKKIEKFLIS